MGEIQKQYANSVAKIIDEGTGKAGKRLIIAAELMSVYIQRANSFSPVSGASYPLPVQARETTPLYGTETPPPQSVQQLDIRRLELEQQLLKLRSSAKPAGIGEQFTALLGAEGGYEDVAMTRGQAFSAAVLQLPQGAYPLCRCLRR